MGPTASSLRPQRQRRGDSRRGRCEADGASHGQVPPVTGPTRPPDHGLEEVTLQRVRKRRKGTGDGRGQVTPPALGLVRHREGTGFNGSWCRTPDKALFNYEKSVKEKNTGELISK